jgi:hypothetical protein
MANGFVRLTAAELIGSGNQLAGAVVELASDRCDALVADGAATRLDDAGAWDFDDIVNGDKDGAEYISSSSAVELTLDDLSGRANWIGDDVFAKVTACVIRNLGTVNVVVGAATGTQFQGPLKATDGTITLRPGDTFAFRRDDTTGYSATAPDLKVAPATGTMLVSVALKGFSS